MIHNLNEQKEIEKAHARLREFRDRPVHPHYHSVSTIDEALALLERFGEEARIFAGGIDLLGLMKNRVISPGVLVNIKPITKMRLIVKSAGKIAIGALTLVNDIETSPLIRSHYPMLFKAAQSTASPHVRNMATIGGNLCQETRCWYFRRSPVTGISFNCRRKSEYGRCYAIDGENQYHAIIGDRRCVSVCPSDLATVLLAMGARVKILDGNGGRLIPIDQLYTPFGTSLGHNEIIETIQVPELRPDVKQRFLKFRLRQTIDFAIVSVASVIKMDKDRVKEATIVLGGVSLRPYRAVKAEQTLIGERITESLAAEAARASVINAKPLNKNGYKVPIMEALVKRSLLE